MTSKLAGLAAAVVAAVFTILAQDVVLTLSSPLRSVLNTLASEAVAALEGTPVPAGTLEPLYYCLFALGALGVGRVAQFGFRPVAFMLVAMAAVLVLTVGLGVSLPIWQVLGLGTVVCVVSLLMAIARLGAVVAASFLASTSATLFYQNFDPTPWGLDEYLTSTTAISLAVFGTTTTLLALTSIGFIRE